MGRRAGSFFAGMLGGLVVLVAGAVLIATGVIDTGEERTVVRETPISGADSEAGKTVQQVYRDEGPGVVFITARGGSDQSPFGLPTERGEATGSGFVIDEEGYILTNDHVVEGSEDVTVRFADEGAPVEAEVKGRDPSTDLALLKVDPGDAELDPVPLGDSSKARVGDPVVAIGNPFGVGRTVTTGIVSAVQREIQAPNGFTIAGAIQTDAAVNPGNSGGPLLNDRGEVIGVNSQIATGGGNGSVGIAFAVPIDTAKQALPELKRTGKVRRPYLGVSTAPVSDGALVVEVNPGSPAEEAGLRGGDRMTGVDGKEVDGPEDITTALADRKPGEAIEVEYVRDGDRRTARLKLGERPAELEQPSEPQEPLIP